MPRFGWIVVVLALLEGGWLAFDGGRALLAGDYVTPRSGPYAGQLGPWAALVRQVGIEPRSTGMKLFHVGLGTATVASAVALAMGAGWAWTAVLVCAVLGLWYLPFGTVLSVAQIVLLLLRPSSP